MEVQNEIWTNLFVDDIKGDTVLKNKTLRFI